VARQISCPTCGRPIQWSEAYPYRPFCSERCRLIDLGAWLTEKHVIPGEQSGAGAEADDGQPGDGGTGAGGRA